MPVSPRSRVEEMIKSLFGLRAFWSAPEMVHGDAAVFIHVHVASAQRRLSPACQHRVTPERGAVMKQKRENAAYAQRVPSLGADLFKTER